MYFWHSKTMTGKWSPNLSDLAPSKPMAGGYAPRLSPVVVLPVAEYDMNLNELAAKYPPPTDQPVQPEKDPSNG